MAYLRQFYLAPLLLLLILPLSVPGQERGSGPSEQQIRARKLATQWNGKKVKFLLSSGEIVTGRPIKANFQTIVLSVRGTQLALATDQIDTVIMRAGAPELLLSGLAGLLGSAFGYGAVQLTVPSASTGNLQTGAAVVGIAAFIFGFRAFFHDIRYDLNVASP